MVQNRLLFGDNSKGQVVENTKPKHVFLKVVGDNNIDTEVKGEVNNVKINLINILSPDNALQVKRYFENLGFNNYYDFYYIDAKEFNKKIRQNTELYKFFKNNIGNPRITSNYIRISQILDFAENIGYERLNLNQLKNQILFDLKNIGITTTNEIQNFGLNEIKKVLHNNSYLKYFIYRKYKKSFFNFNINDLIKFSRDLGFITLDNNEILVELKNRFYNDYKVEYLDDLIDMKVADFSTIVGKDYLLSYYFLQSNIHKSDMNRKIVDDFGKDIGLTKRQIDQDKGVKDYLRKNNIISYTDLKEMGVIGARQFLGADESCKLILRSLGIKSLQDIRENHIKRFARRVGLSGIIEVSEVDDQEVIKKMLNMLSQDDVTCYYSLKLKGIQYFKKKFNKTYINEILYNQINGFIKSKTGLTVTELRLGDIDSISNILGFKKLTDLEHKEKLSSLLLAEGLDLDRLTKKYLKEKYWHNEQFRFFLEKIGVFNLSELRSKHIIGIKEYILKI